MLVYMLNVNRLLPYAGSSGQLGPQVRMLACVFCLLVLCVCPCSTKGSVYTTCSRLKGSCSSQWREKGISGGHLGSSVCTRSADFSPFPTERAWALELGICNMNGLACCLLFVKQVSFLLRHYHFI